MSSRIENEAIATRGARLDTPEKAPDVSGPTGRESAQSYCSRFESLGLALPDQERSSQRLLESCQHKIRVDLERLTGIKSRRICRDAEDSYTLALAAVRDCLAHSKYRGEEMEVVINCSITSYRGGDYFQFEPGLSFLIKEAIGATQALHLDVRNACAGMVTGVQILDDLVRRGVVKCGILVSGERISSISDNAAMKVRSILSRQLASLTVGDSGTAVIVERATNGSPGIMACELATHAQYSDLCIGKFCNWAPGAAMYTRSRKIHRAAVESAHVTIGRALNKSGMKVLPEVDWLIPHQASKRAIRNGDELISPKLGGHAKNVVTNVSDLGNTATTTHFVALYQWLSQKKLKAGEDVMLLALASGVVCGSLIFRLDEIVERYGNDC